MLHVNIWTRRPIIRLLEAEVTERDSDKQAGVNINVAFLEPIRSFSFQCTHFIKLFGERGDSLCFALQLTGGPRRSGGIWRGVDEDASW